MGSSLLLPRSAGCLLSIVSYGEYFITAIRKDAECSCSREDLSDRSLIYYRSIVQVRSSEILHTARSLQVYQHRQKAMIQIADAYG